jgi:type II secretory pathway component PulM
LIKQKWKEAEQTFHEWWLNLAVRERYAITIGTSFVAIFIIYKGLFTPFMDYVNTLRERIDADQKLLFLLKAADKEIQKREGQVNNLKTVLSPVTLMSDVQKQITHDKLDSMLTQIKQANNQAIEVHFQNIDFDKLIRLLITITKKENVMILQMSVVAAPTPGIVNADIILSTR